LQELSEASLAAKVVGIESNGDIVMRLKTFMVSDGTFRSTIASKESSLVNAKIALRVMALNAGAGSQSALDDIAEAALALLPVGDDEKIIDPTILSLLSKISSKKPRLIGPRLDVVAESLLQLRYSDDLEVIAGVLESLNVVMTYKALPVYTKFRSSIIESDSVSKTLTVDVMDVFGNVVAVDAIEVKAMKRAGRDGIIYQGPLDGNLLDLSSQDGIVPGLYSVNLAITLPGQTNAVLSTLNLVVHGKLDVINVAVGVTANKQMSISDLAPVTTQNSLHDLSASAISGDFVHLSFGIHSPMKSGKRFQKPHQVFVKFTHVDSGASSFFVGIADGQLGEVPGSKYRAVVSLSKEIETFVHQSGIYTISLLISDVSYDTPVEWVVGSLDLQFPAKVVKDFALYVKPLMYTSDNTLKALPEISHVMRPDSKRASTFMATIFTVLTAAPLVIFIGFILSLGPNLKRLQSIASISFVICLLATLLLYAGYWMALKGVNFYETIKYLCFLAPLTIVIGTSAVSSVTQARLSEKKSA
jgi:hypothetical protein